MHYAAGILLGLACRDYQDINLLIHATRRDEYGKRVRVFSMSEALAILNGYHDARRVLGRYATE